MTNRPWLDEYDSEVPREFEVEEVLLTTYLRRTAEAWPQRTAIVFQGARLSYDRLAHDVGRLSTALTRMGVVPGTRVAVHLPNLPQTVIAYYAALAAGAEVVLTNPLYTAPEIEHQWNDADCRVAITTDFLFERTLRHMRERVPVHDYIVASIPEYLPFPQRLLAPFVLRRKQPAMWARVTAEDGVHRFRELVRRTPARPGPALEFEATAVLQYTGGTTGVSKAAVLTHRNLSANMQQVDAWFHGADQGQEVMLTCLPLFHCFGMTVGQNWAVARAMTMVLIPNPRDVEALLNAISEEHVTIFPGVPALYNALNQHPRIGSVDVSSIKSCISGSAPIPAEVMRRFEELTGATISEGYGLSEASPVTHSNPTTGTRRPGWIGLPLPGTDSRIVDAESGTTDLPAGEEGELVVRGPQVMQGYWNKPEETALALRDGWLFTGDLAVMSEDGFFRIVGRKKDMINCSGFKVYPDEVDSVLVEHDAILEAATIGVPDEAHGELVLSYVVLQPGQELGVEGVREWCKQRLAPYKVPRRVEFLDELPKSTVLKVLRRELRELALRDSQQS